MSKEYVIVPKEDYVDTCDAIREKINSTALLKSDEMAQAVRDISSPKEEQEKKCAETAEKFKRAGADKVFLTLAELADFVIV